MNGGKDHLIERLLPLACVWAEEQERRILEAGVGLTEPQLANARSVGVARPDKVRLMPVNRIPTPTVGKLGEAAAATGLISPDTEGMTVRYGIFIRRDCWGRRLLVAHELVHTAQYERLGGFEAFLRPYLSECLAPPGYPHGPLEREAIITSLRQCHPA